jgi:hypothetical protein
MALGKARRASLLKSVKIIIATETPLVYLKLEVKTRINFGNEMGINKIKGA